MGYKIPNKYLDDINAELKALHDEEISDEHRAIMKDVDKKCSAIEGLRGIDPLSKRNIGGDGIK